MDLNCNCFGIAASSKRPVKRYNMLVPDIFPKQSPPLEDRIDPATERKLKKLFEYLEKNLHRGPKISRRLARMINRSLASQQPGYVQIAVAAYTYLLEHLRDADSVLFAKEVIYEQVARPDHFYYHLVPAPPCLAPSPDLQEDEKLQSILPPPILGQPELSVVGILLNSSVPAMQSLGAQLLASFTRQQITIEYHAHIENFLEQACALVVEGRKGGKPCLACLEVLQEYIRLCCRTSTSGHYLPLLTSTLLSVLILDPAQENAGHAEAHGVVQQSARQAFQELGKLAQVPTHGKLVVHAILQFLDKAEGWSHGRADLRTACIQLVNQVFVDEQQRYTAFSLLLRHAGSPSLASQQRCTLIATACQEGLELPPVLASAAFILAVKELSCVMEGAEGDVQGGEAAEVQQLSLEAITRLAGAQEGPQHLLEALAGLCMKVSKPTNSTYMLACMQAAAETLPQLASKLSSMPQSLLYDILLCMLHPDAVVAHQAHTLLQTILAANVTLGPTQVHLLASAIWHQVTQPCHPEAFVAISKTLERVTRHTDAGSLQDLALLQAALLSFDQTDSLSAAQAVAVLLLQKWLHQLLGLRQLTPSNRQLSIERAPHLRLSEDGLELSGTAGDFGEADNQAAAQQLLQLMEARQSCIRTLAAEDPNKNARSFEPIALTALQQRQRGRAGSVFGRGGVGSRPGTADLDGNHPNGHLRLAISPYPIAKSTRATHQLRSMAELLQDINSQPPLTGAPSSDADVSSRVQKALEAIDQLLERDRSGAAPIADAGREEDVIPMHRSSPVAIESHSEPETGVKDLVNSTLPANIKSSSPASRAEQDTGHEWVRAIPLNAANGHSLKGSGAKDLPPSASSRGNGSV